MRLLHLTSLLGALALAACSTPAAGPSPTPPAASPTPYPTPDPTDTLEVKATKALIIAELTYNTAANAMLKATQAGVIRPRTIAAERVRELNEQAVAALTAARTAVDAASKLSAAQEALSLVQQLQDAIPEGVER